MAVTMATSVSTEAAGQIVVPHTFVVPAKSEESCSIEYLPLKVGESMGRISFTSAELGVYQYDLRLTAVATPQERSLHFMAGLGGMATQTFRFVSYTKTKTDYVCKIDSNEFSVDRTISAPAAITACGIEIFVDVTFEPSRLGDMTGSLSIN